MPAQASAEPRRSTSDSHWDLLTGDSEHDQRNVQILLDSVAELYGSHGLEDLMRGAVERAIRVTGAERGILLLDRGRGELDVAVARDADGRELSLDEPYSRSVVKKVWCTGEPSLMKDAADVDSLDLTHSILALQLISVMGVPLPVKGRSLGVLYVDSTAQVKEFTPSDFAVFKSLGGLVALAVENARLMAEREAKERMERELLMAQKIQQRLLPARLPELEGFDIAGLSRPCDEVSGDYYDVMPYDDERFALIVGDVSAHGLGPAMLMASTRAAIHTALLTRPEPLELIRSVNVFVERDTPPESFMSMFFGVLDPLRRELHYVSAGHEPPLLFKPDGALEELPPTGRVLGVLADSEYALSAARTLPPGHVLMLYTDGIYEAKNTLDEMYGEERFQASFAQHARNGRTANEIIERVLGDLELFVGGRPLEDDVTCLVVRAV